MAGPEERSDGGEVLDLGVVGDGVRDRAGASGPRPRVSRRGVLAGAAALAVAGALAALDLRSRGPDGARPPTPSPSTSPSPSAVGPTAPAPSGQAGPPVAVGRLGGPVLGGAGGWDLFAYTDGAVLRIRPATGEVTRTRIHEGGDGPFSLVPVRGRVLLHRDDYRPGYAVDDGGAITALPARLAGAGPMLPGPDLDHVWVQELRQGRPGLALRGIDGSGAGPWLRLPPFLYQPPLPDGAGGALLVGVGGVYRGGPGDPRLVTSGALVAVGRAGCLTVDCDPAAACGTTLHTWDGSRRAIPLTVDPSQQGTISAISPDGTTLAWITSAQPGVFGLTLVDLGDGRRRLVDQPVASFGGAVVAWSPDSRWLAVIGEDAQLHQVDVRTARSSPVSPELPTLQQVAVRASS